MSSKPSHLRAAFSKDDGSVFIEISNTQDKFNVVRRKATPEDCERFPAEYAAYEAGLSEPDVGGTPLTDVPGVSKEIARGYKMKGIRNAEELAGLSDAGCTQLGMGAVNARKAAQNLLAANETVELRAALAASQGKSGKGAKPEAAAA